MGYSHTRDHIESFRIDRIKSRALEKTAEPMPNGFNISEYASVVFGMHGEMKILDPPEVKEAYWQMVMHVAETQ